MTGRSVLLAVCVLGCCAKAAAAELSVDVLTATLDSREVSAYFKHSSPDGCDCVASGSDGCLTTAVLISATEDSIRGRTAGASDVEDATPARVGLTLLVEDACTGQQLVRGSSLNTVPRDQVEISPRLAFARVEVKAFQFENLVTAAVETVSIDLAWEPSGPRYQIIGGNPDARSASARGSVVIDSAGERLELISRRTFAAFFNRTTVCNNPGLSTPVSQPALAVPSNTR